MLHHFSYLNCRVRCPALAKSLGSGRSGLPRASADPSPAALLGHIAITFPTSGVVLVVEDNATKLREDVPRPLVKPEGHGERRGEGIGVHGGLKIKIKI